MVIIFFALAWIAAGSQPVCVLPDRESCTLAHGFVIGEMPFSPGTIEIWYCSGKTIVALKQARDLPEGNGPTIRNFFCPALGADERLMGCRGETENFDGTVAIAGTAGGARPELREAWLADTVQWKFVPTSRDDLICNRGLTVN
jgi:hypothetical protein